MKDQEDQMNPMDEERSGLLKTLSDILYLKHKEIPYPKVEIPDYFNIQTSETTLTINATKGGIDQFLEKYGALETPPEIIDLRPFRDPNRLWGSRRVIPAEKRFPEDISPSIGSNIVECGLGRIGLHSLPVQHLKNQWARFILTHGPEAKFLQICHSGGADHVRNALLTSSESVRQRVIVLAINPSVVISKRLCYDADNYASRRDFVTRLDIIGRLKHRDELHILEPHAEAKFWDHEFVSLTFEQKIKSHIQDYIENYGGIK